jgi:site-specific recombinase XerD
VVHGKGGKQRVIPISDYLAQLIRDGAPKSWLFPNGSGGHLTSQHVGKLVAQAAGSLDNAHAAASVCHPRLSQHP